MVSVKVTYAAQSANHRRHGLARRPQPVMPDLSAQAHSGNPRFNAAGFQNFYPTAADSAGEIAGNIYRYRRVEILLAGFATALPSCPKKNRLARPWPELTMSFSGSTDARDSGARGRHAGLTNIKNQSEMKTENLTTNLSFPDCGSMAIIALLWLFNIFHVLTHVKISRVLAFNIMLTYYQDMAGCSN